MIGRNGRGDVVFASNISGEKMQNINQPLRTRERAAVEVARKYLRIIERCDEDKDGVIRGLAADALYEIAQALGERS